MDSVCLRDDACHRRGDDAAQGAGRLRHRAGRLAGLDDVVKKQNTHLVAGDGDIFTVGIADHGSDTVGVGIRTDDEVAVHFLGQVHRQIEAFRILRVRANDCREIAVDHHLFGHRINMLHSQALQRFGNQLVAAAVERRIDNAELIRHCLDGIRVNSLLHDLLKEGLVGFLADHGDLAVFDCFFVIAGLEAGEEVCLRHAFCNCVGLLRGQLSTVRPVDFIPVVLLRVVAGGNIEACGCAIVADGKAQLRSRTQCVKDPDIDSVRSHYRCGFFGILASVETAVMCYDDALFLGCFSFSADYICEGLGCMANDVDIHVVQAGFHGTAQTGSAELQRSIESLPDLFFVVGNGVELCPLLFAECRAVQPALILFHECMHFIPPAFIVFIYGTLTLP